MKRLLTVTLSLFFCGMVFGQGKSDEYYEKAYKNLLELDKKAPGSKFLGNFSANPYPPNSTGNQYGPYGNPYSANSIKNEFGTYGSPFSSKSATNPYATDTPKLYDSQGKYRGKLSSNPYDADSISNPYGKYGSPFSSESIMNQFGAGSPYKSDSPWNPYGTGLEIRGKNDSFNIPDLPKLPTLPKLGEPPQLPELPVE